MPPATASGTSAEDQNGGGRNIAPVKTLFNRRRALTAGTGAALSLVLPWKPSRAQTPLTGKEFAEDFDVLWKGIADSYAYFDQKSTDWDRVRDVYRPRAAEVKSPYEFVLLLEQVLEELYDFHTSLNTNTEASAVLVPTDADLWAEWRNGRAVIVDVRLDSPAHRARVLPGTEVLAIQGVSVRKAVQDRLGRCLRSPDPAAENWALETLLAGRHNQPQRRIDLRLGGKTTAVALESAHREYASLLDDRTLGPSNDIGYVRPNNSLGDSALIPEFDRALARLKDTKGLLLDLRETPSGGNTLVARALMGRFVEKDAFYQKHSIPSEERAHGVRRSWVEIVSPRGPFRYERPVAVLVNHWTGSMGEGIALGMDATKRAQVVGVEMARLLGGIGSVTLPKSGFGVRFPTEKLFHPNGTPREKFVPSVYVDLPAGFAANKADPILDAGLATLRKRLPTPRR